MSKLATAILGVCLGACGGSEASSSCASVQSGDYRCMNGVEQTCNGAEWLDCLYPPGQYAPPYSTTGTPDTPVPCSVFATSPTGACYSCVSSGIFVVCNYVND